MVNSKCADYDVAELYVKQAKGDVDMALEAWQEDEKWERENPFEKGKMGRRKNIRGGGSTSSRKNTSYGGGLTGQLG